MNITLKQIEAFYWTVQLRSLTRAAERLSASQPAMSARIAELEQALGMKLFVRMPRGLNPTAKGRQFLVYAEQFLSLTDEVQAHVCMDEITLKQQAGEKNERKSRQNCGVVSIDDISSRCSRLPQESATG